MKYIVEWQMGGEIEIDTEGTDWTPEELESQVAESLSEAEDKAVECFTDEFDDCDITPETVSEYKLRRIR